MTKERILETMDLAKNLTKGYKNRQFTEDFTQFALEKRLGGRKASVGELLIDFVRAEFGDTRVKLGKNIKANKCLEFRPEHEDVISYTANNNIDFNKVISKFTGQDRAILVLYCEWQFDMKEIAKVLGMSESRISQRFKSMKPELKELAYEFGLQELPKNLRSRK